MSVVAGNVYDKYRTSNPIARRLQEGFLAAGRQLLSRVELGRVLEVGCGPGDLSEALDMDGAHYLGTDLSTAEVRHAATAYPHRRFASASIYDLPFDDDQFDTVICCEVLEHLDDPETGLREVARVCRQQALISVPWEPTWRMLNLVRGAYVRDLGNTPGHLQHFSRGKIRALVGRHFEIVDSRHPLPWTMVFARVKPSLGDPARPRSEDTDSKTAALSTP